MFRRNLDLRPDVFRLARVLAERPGLCVLWDATGQGPSYLACDPSEVSHALEPELDLALPRANDAEPDRGGIPRWIGALPYEAQRHLERSGRGRPVEDRAAPQLERPLWLRFEAVVRVDPGEPRNSVQVVGDHPDAVEVLCRRLQSPPSRIEGTLALKREEEPDLHQRRIEQALRWIERGELYQVNLARRFDFLVTGRALALLEPLARRTMAPFCSYLSWEDHEVLATSPELFLETRAGLVSTAPIKGTRPRVDDAALDRKERAALEADPKEQAELSMVIDVERNDLGRVCRAGSVRLARAPRVRSHPTLHHREALVTGQLAAGADRATVLEAMLPSGSVTGAPKVRAMELIALLEAERRGLYTGAIGSIDQAGELRLGMAIRCLGVRGGVGHYFAGGGIVADSDPELEVAETRWKALQYLELSR